ncbi:hypothetical protein ScPMuIL_017469 [Solemya velum]
MIEDSMIPVTLTFLFLWVATWQGLTAAPKSRDEGETQDINFLMPEVQPNVKDTYLCIPMKMNRTATFMTGFKPHANKDIAHHMLLYGCTTPGSQAKVWNCGEMAHSTSKYSEAPVCAGGPKILYAWAMDAPSLSLPKDVAFKVGGETDIRYLVLQVHYKDVSSFLPPKNGKDSSGITMITSQTSSPKRAGVYLMGTGGMVPKKSTVYMETACSFEENLVVFPFAYRTHAHTHGMVTSGYRIRNGQWTEIGRMSPQKPQMFYNVTNNGMDVKKGDILAARCTMVNDENKDISIGNTQNDEMCNFYIMYYIDGDRTMRDTYCFSPGPPSWSWKTFDQTQKMHLENLPATASVRPDTGEELIQTPRLETRNNNDLMSDLKEFDPSYQFGEDSHTYDGVDKLSSILDKMYGEYHQMEDDYPEYNNIY